jgi:hypothetical protein
MTDPMTLRPAASLLASLLLFAATTPIAGQSPSRLIGLTATNTLVVTQDPGTCAMAQCPPLSIAPFLVPFVGGTAHDGRTRGTWVCQGIVIAKVDSRSQCAFQCPPVVMPNTATGNEVTGLAFDEIAGRLWVTDRSGVIRWYRVNGCVLTLESRCSPVLPPSAVLSGCATDEGRGLLFYSVSTPGLLGGEIHVARQSAPCLPICRIPLTQCALGALFPLQGLAFDACRQVLWATDGRRTVGGTFTLSPLGPCTFTEVQCCADSTGDGIIGLCILPGTEQSLGQPCTRAPCASCPNMRHVLGGEPTVGNPAFSLDLIQAPAASNAWVVLNVGPCALPGTPIGAFCAPLLVPLAPPPLVGGPFATGGAGCTGSVRFGLPVPTDVTLCGVGFSSQFLGLCSGAPQPGTLVSNCVSFAVSPS